MRPLSGVDLTMSAVLVPSLNRPQQRVIITPDKSLKGTVEERTPSVLTPATLMHRTDSLWRTDRTLGRELCHEKLPKHDELIDLRYN